MRRHGSKHDRDSPADYHCKHGLHEHSDVQSGHREEGYAVRDRERMPFPGRRPEDDKVSEYRSGIPGRELEEASPDIFRMDWIAQIIQHEVDHLVGRII